MYILVEGGQMRNELLASKTNPIAAVDFAGHESSE